MVLGYVKEKGKGKYLSSGYQEWHLVDLALDMHTQNKDV